MTTPGPYQPLLALATPDLYRLSPFQVLHLSPRATAREAQRALKRKEMKGQLGLAASTFAGSQSAASATKEDLQAAMDHLAGDPALRLLAEVFWFWPTAKGATDLAIDAWGQGNAEAARTHWQGQAKDASLGPIATHNLAVLDHMGVLDAEAALTSAPRDARPARAAELGVPWARVFSQWRQTIEADGFWGAVTDRIREIDDARLSPDLVRPIRDTLPQALLTINARLAYAAAERGDSATAKRQLELMTKAGLGDPAIQGAMGEVVKPLRARIHTLVDQAKARWGETPQHGNRIVRDLHAQVKPLLAVADALLPGTDFTRTGLHDLVAQTIIDGEAAYSIKTCDWREGCALLALAEGVVVAETVRAKIVDSIRQNKEIIEQGNDWCAPGYWDLPAGTIEALEAARKKYQAGDLDGAIADLVVMDATIGTPLRRAFACAMSIKGIRISNTAHDDYNAESGVIKAILDRIRGLSSHSAAQMLANRPDPHSPSYLNPPCLSCGSRYYTRWVNFTYRDLPLFMCSDCNERDDRETASRKERLRGELRAALECLLLANEIDSRDPGVARNLKVIKELAGQVACRVPGTGEIRQRIAPKSTGPRGVSMPPDLPAAGAPCHFCHQAPGVQGRGIFVRMSGDIRRINLLFGSSSQFSYLDVTVPRCQRCRDAHAHLPRRIKDWDQAADATGVDGKFPEFLAELTTARTACRASDGRAEAARKAIAQITAAQTQALNAAQATLVEAERRARDETAAAAAVAKDLAQAQAKARAVLAEAEAIGTRCDRCHSDQGWTDHLCARCDRPLLQIGWLGRAAVALAAVLAFGATVEGLHLVPEAVAFGGLQLEGLSGWNADEAAAWWPMAAAALSMPVLAFGANRALGRAGEGRRRQIRRRRAEETAGRRQAVIAAAEADIERTSAALAEHEAQEIQARASRDEVVAQARAHLDGVKAAAGSPEARARMAKANEALAAAIAEGQSLANALKAVEARLAAAKAAAIAAYRETHPKPGLPVGVAPEDSYTTYPGISDRQAAGWGIGMVVRIGGVAHDVSRTAAHAQGLVGG